MANVSASLKNWSVTAGSNQPDAADAATVQADLQQLQATVRADLATVGADIASATTTDLGAVAGSFHHITGTTTITGFGTVSAGICKHLTFDGALTLTHHATSLTLPGGANITTVAGDCAEFVSEGSGNWRCTYYSPRTVTGTGAAVKATAPTISALVATSVRTQIGQTGSLAQNTPSTNILTGVANYQTWLVYANAVATTSLYGSAIIFFDGGGTGHISAIGAGGITFTVGANEVYVQHNNASAQGIYWGAVRLQGQND